MIAQGFNWWCEGLATAFLHVERDLNRPHHFRLPTQARPLALQPTGASRAQSDSSIPLSEGDPTEAILARTRGSIIEIVVPAAAILERKLDPLPAESQPYVESVVQHQIDKIFPWRSSDVLYAISIQKRDDAKIDVTVQATPRAPIASALAFTTACGASEVTVVGDDETYPDKVRRILVPGVIEAQRRLSRFFYSRLS
jgi:hypothetical protein